MFDQNFLLNLIYVLVCRDEFGMYLPSPAFSMHNNPPTPQKRRLVTRQNVALGRYMN